MYRSGQCRQPDLVIITMVFRAWLNVMLKCAGHTVWRLLEQAEDVGTVWRRENAHTRLDESGMIDFRKLL